MTAWGSAAGGAGGVGRTPEDAAHELLVRLAGRLPDDVLWRLRDWLSTSAFEPVATVLPRVLLRGRLGLTEHERELLARCVDEHSPSRRLVDAILPLPELDEPTVVFTSGSGLPDLATMSATAVTTGHPGVSELRETLRGTRNGRAERGQRVVLVLGADRPWELTGTLQRLLRVHGDRTPCVEVLPSDTEVPAYHQAAIVGSSLIWSAPVQPTGVSPEPAAVATTAPTSGALTAT